MEPDYRLDVPNNLLDSQKTIESLKNELLKLKMKYKQLKDETSMNGSNNNNAINKTFRRPPEPSLDETKRDLIAILHSENEDLKKRLEEMEDEMSNMRSRPEQVEVGTQTKLDRLNVDRLIEASVTLKRQKRDMEQREQQQQQHQHQHQHQQQHHHHQQQQQHDFDSHLRHQPKPETHIHQNVQLPTYTQRHEQQTQPKVVSQHYYPHVTLQKQTSLSNRQLNIDEKKALETLFAIDGLLTTSLDKLRATIDN